MTSDTVAIEPLTLSFDAVLPMPGSKSHTNRAIVAACLAPGETLLRHATPCDDVALLVRNVQTLGYDAEWTDREAGALRIRGGTPAASGSAVLDCGNAGTTLRFLTSLACITPGDWTLTGDERMRSRPIGDLTAALRALGADIDDTDGCPPLRIRGKRLAGGAVTLDASKSSQFLTSLLLIGAVLEHGLDIAMPSDPASPTYIDLTERVLRDFGVTLERQTRRYRIAPQTIRAPHTYEIEGDWSAVGAYLVLAELTGSRIDVPNLRPDSPQGDRLVPHVIAALRGDGSRTVDCADIPDQLMNLAVLAAHRKGDTTFTGAANLRLKECDRLAATREELGKLGIQIEEQPDGLVVHGAARLCPAVLDARNDHRMAMCFAVLGSLTPGVTIQGPACVSKSYPRFFEDLRNLHRSPRCVAIVGMRGSGKSHLGRKVAAKLKLAHVDTDKVFIAAHGEIKTYVALHGWDAFRAEEERVVAEALRPGNVVSLGGGAIESAATRQALRKASVNVWLDVRAGEITERLKKLQRPALTDLPLEKEVPMILAKRNPLYAEVASIRIPPSIPFPRHVPWVISQLRRRCSW
jgi:3-phosphoshikimate 1-carboxyvinyltransferase